MELLQLECKNTLENGVILSIPLQYQHHFQDITATVSLYLQHLQHFSTCSFVSLGCESIVQSIRADRPVKKKKKKKNQSTDSTGELIVS